MAGNCMQIELTHLKATNEIAWEGMYFYRKTKAISRRNFTHSRHLPLSVTFGNKWNICAVLCIVVGPQRNCISLCMLISHYSNYHYFHYVSAKRTEIWTGKIKHKLTPEREYAHCSLAMWLCANNSAYNWKRIYGI